MDRLSNPTSPIIRPPLSVRNGEDGYPVIQHLKENDVGKLPGKASLHWSTFVKRETRWAALNGIKATLYLIEKSASETR